MINTKVKGLDKLTAKLDQMPKVLQEGLTEGTDALSATVQTRAKSNAPVDTGELRNSIHRQIEQQGLVVKAKITTNTSYAIYVEFGTGVIGEKSAKEIPAGMAINYRQDGWLVPVEYFPNYENYGMKAIEINGNLFVPTNGMPARQFMTKAYRSVEPAEAAELVGSHVINRLKGLGD